MRYLRVILLVLLLAVINIGCLHRSEISLNPWKWSQQDLGKDAIYMQYIIVDRPLGDPTMDQLIWNELDEMVVPTEQRPAMEENGFRIGLISGNVPSTVQDLIAAPHHPKGRRFRNLIANQWRSIDIGDPIPSGSVIVKKPGEAQSQTMIALEKAQCSLSLRPKTKENGQIQLEIVPELQHEEKKNWLNVGTNHLFRDRNIEKLNQLAWKVTLSRGDYLVIGTYASEKSSLGNTFFVKENELESHQQLIILMVGSFNKGTDYQFANDDDSSPSKRTVIPLAEQTTRGFFPNVKSQNR